MENLKDYIESGIIQSYVLGLATDKEVAEVEALAASHTEVRNAIEEFSIQLETEAFANAVQPDPLVKPMLMATIDFISRMENGEQPTVPPILNEGSTIEDYKAWLDRKDFSAPLQTEEIFAKIIAFNSQATTAIVWLKDMAPQEVHHNEYERFLVVEGSCEITIGENLFPLSVGDYLQIPLHQKHSVKVTSLVPCKVILQRVAA